MLKHVTQFTDWSREDKCVISLYKNVHSVAVECVFIKTQLQGNENIPYPKAYAQIFTVALFTQQKYNNLNIYQMMTGYIKDEIYPYNDCSTIKKNEVLMHATTWVNLVHYVKWKKPRTKGHILYGSIFMKGSKQRNL